MEHDQQSTTVGGLRLKIDGMKCQGCAEAAQAALKSVAGVESACVKLSTHSALITGNPDPKALLQALSEKSFQASLIN